MVMTTPTAGTVICLNQKILHDDVDVDMWSLSTSVGVRKYSRTTEVAIFANMDNLNQKDSRGIKMLSCWYFMKVT
jgi:hypothetical protein